MHFWELLALLDVIISFQSGVLFLGKQEAVGPKSKYLFKTFCRVVLFQVFEDAVENQLHRLALVLSLENGTKENEVFVSKHVLWVDGFVGLERHIKQGHGGSSLSQDVADFSKVLQRQDRWWVREDLAQKLLVPRVLHQIIAFEFLIQSVFLRIKEVIHQEFGLKVLHIDFSFLSFLVFGLVEAC